ncbi:Iron-sulfur assembly protein 1 [Pleurostoma richardsiae]|uniref:Iron-sulfur assembly protein 1 n=1 Tax=Pleurostoma richardsiae TaxID=41990 RepID=A0AA38RGA1_9PEZI|nr:Iron-sulfur assembly protein 1 [Pleurostoma richardsiae]
MNAPTLIARRATSTSICLACRRSLLRQFSSAGALAVPTAFQSYPLNPQPATPPRNSRAPETSITHPIDAPLPRVHETRPPKNARKFEVSPQPAAVPEKEAQKSKAAFADHSPSSAAQQAATATSSSPSTHKSSPSTAAPTTVSTSATTPKTTPAAAPSPRPRSKLRTPRKAAMKLTPSAVDHLRSLLEGPEPKLIKVGVRNRGCSGLAYHLEYVDKPGAFDETVEQDGVRVLIDSKALFSIIGSEMDWVEDKLNQRFVFRNPNIKEECGCGESFMV